MPGKVLRTKSARRARKVEQIRAMQAAMKAGKYGGNLYRGLFSRGGNDSKQVVVGHYMAMHGAPRCGLSGVLLHGCECCEITATFAVVIFSLKGAATFMRIRVSLSLPSSSLRLRSPPSSSFSYS